MGLELELHVLPMEKFPLMDDGDSVMLRVRRNNIGGFRDETLEFHNYCHKTFCIAWPKSDDDDGGNIVPL